MTQLKTTDYLLSLCLGLAFGVFLYGTTPLGLAMSPDSVGYLTGARGVASEGTLRLISNQWPPLYPLVIGLVAKLINSDVLVSARVLQSLSLTCLTASLLLLQIRLGVGRRAAIFSMLLVIFSPSLLHVIYYAWSESLFFLLLFINLCIAAHIYQEEKEQKSLTSLCIQLGITAGLAFASRYVGITLIAFNLAIFAYFVIRDRTRRSLNLLCVYTLAVSALTIPWILYYHVTSDSLTRREFYWHPITLEQASSGLQTIGRTFLLWRGSSQYLYIAAGLLTICATLSIFTHIRNKDRLSASNILYLLLQSYAFIYIIFIIFSISFIDIATPLDERILLPATLIFLIVLSGYIIKHCADSLSLKVCIVIFTIFYFYYSTQYAKGWIRLNTYNGAELTAKNNRVRPILDFLRSCPATYRLASNVPWDFEIDLQKQLTWLPRPFDMMSGKKNSLFENQIETLPKKFDVIVITPSERQIYKQIWATSAYVETYSGADGAILIREGQEGFCKGYSR